MSSHLVALAALAEVVAWAAWHKSLSLDLAMPLALTLVSRFFAYFALQYGALKFYHVVVYPNYVSPLRHLPGPKDNFPFMGQGKKLLTASSPIEDYVKWGNTWPDAPFIRHLTLGNMEVLLVNTPEAHREVLQTHCYSFRKPDILYRLVGEIIGRGLLFTEGEEHKKQRRILAGLFSASSIKRMLPIFHEKARSLTKFLEQGLDENRRVTFEAVDAFSKMTIDVVGVTVLGVELGNLSASDKKMDFLKCYHRLFNQSPLGALIGFVNIYVPVRKWLPVEANLGFIRANAELRRMVSMCVRERVQEIEEKQRRQQADGKAKEGSVDGDGGRDLLTMMVEERRNFKKEDELTEEDMVNHLLTFLAAGHETTASAMTWAAYILATKPGVQDKIRAEISAVLATSANAEPDLAEIERLHYLNNFCREVLRLFSPAISSYREAIADMTICGTFVPKGTAMLVVPAVTSLARASWGDDVDEFVPERWDLLESPGSKNPYAVGAFMHGPRVCIAKHFSLVEFKALLIDAVRSFRFLPGPQLEALAGRLPAVDNPALAFRPKGGLHIVLEKI